MKNLVCKTGKNVEQLLIEEMEGSGHVFLQECVSVHFMNPPEHTLKTTSLQMVAIFSVTWAHQQAFSGTLVSTEALPSALIPIALLFPGLFVPGWLGTGAALPGRPCT